VEISNLMLPECDFMRNAKWL